MSKSVDERVVEMRFDNKQFESNVQTSISTLDKLKRALNLDGAAKGLSNVGAAANKVDMSGLSKGVDTVNARFGALQVAGMTAISNITTAAMQAGSNIVKSFTLDPITSGFREYETQLNSVQTIMANTASKGTTIEQVTAALNELNEYADLTIYNFTEMTKNIGTFTAAGVGLEESVGAIKGIANLGAMSGSTSLQVSTAMYQLSQALAAGRVSLMDWNSVVNAGMGGEQFQTALKRTATAMGTNVDAMIEKYGSFRESLTQGGWLTAEVLTETLNQIAGVYSKEDLIAQGYAESQAEAIVQMAQTATDAATKVKTFSQLMSTMGEALGSGWAQTWQLIFGDFYEARDFFTDLSNYFGEIIGKISDARNTLIGDAFGGGESSWTEFTAQIQDAGISVDDFQAKLNEVAKAQGVSLDDLITQYGDLSAVMTSGEISSGMISDTLNQLADSAANAGQSTDELNNTLKYYQDIVSRVWRGDFKNAPERYELLAEAGYDYKVVQDLVNKTVDDHTVSLEDLSDAQLTSIGYTEEEVKQIRELAAAASTTGSSLNTLIESMSRRSGRELFLESLFNVVKAIVTPLEAVAKAWNDVFAVDANDLYGLLESFNSLSASLIMVPEDAEKVTRVFKGLFSVVHLLATAFSKSLVFGIKAANKLLEPFGTNVLDLAANVGDALVAFDNWITSGTFIDDMLDKLGTTAEFVAFIITKFFDAFGGYAIVDFATTSVTTFFSGLYGYLLSLGEYSPGEIVGKVFEELVSIFKDTKDKLKSITWQDVLNALTKFNENVRAIFKKLVEDAKEMGPDIIEGLQNGLEDGVDGVFKFIEEVATKLIEAAKAILGIHSPSTVFFEIGKNIIDGLCNGITYFSGKVTDTLGAVISDVKSLMSGIDWMPIIGISAGVGAFVVLYQLTDALQTFATGLSGFSAPFTAASGLIKSVQTTVNSFNDQMFGTNTASKGFKNFSEGIKILAEAFAILAASVGALTLLDSAKLWESVKVIGALAAIMVVTAGAMAGISHLVKETNVLQSLNLTGTILAIGASLIMLSVAARIAAGIPDDGFQKAAAALLGFGIIVGLLLSIANYSENQMSETASFLLSVGAAFMMLAVTAKVLGTMSSEEMLGAAGMLAVFGTVVGALIALTKFAGKSIGKAAAFVTQVGVAFLLLTATAKILGGMSYQEMLNASAMLAVFGVIVGSLIAITKFGKKSIAEVTGFIGAVGLSFVALAIAAKLLGGMSAGEMVTAGAALAGLTGIIAALVAITRLAPKEEIAKISATLLSMSLAIGILAGISILLSYVELKNLVKGIAAVAALSAMMALMVHSTKGAADIQGTMLGIAVAIAAIAASVAVLSFIEPSKLFTAVAAMSALMAMLALVVKAASGLGSSVGPLITLTIAIAAIAGALILLSDIPGEQLVSSSASLSTALLSVAAACKIMSSVGKVSIKALGAMVAIEAIMVGLVGIFALMSAANVQSAIPNAIAMSLLLNALASATLILSMVKNVAPMALGAMLALANIMIILAAILSLMSTSNIQGNIANAVALSVLVNALAAASLVLSTIKAVAPTALVAIGVLTVVIAGLAGILYLMQDINPTSLIPTAIAISTLLLAMVGITAILGLIGPVATTAIAGAAGLVGVITVIGAFVAALGAISGQITELGSWIEQGGDILQKIGTAIGQFVGGIVGGVAQGVTGSLPDIAANLSQFMINLTPFLLGAKMITPESMQSIKDLAAAIVVLTAADFISGITSFLGMGDPFADLGKQLATLGSALSDFANATSGIDPAHTALAAMALRNVISAMSGVPNSGGFLGDLLGGKDYSGFANGMTSIGLALSSFYLTTSLIQDPAKLMQNAQALKSVIEAISTVPNSGGLLGDLLGGKDYSGFAEGMNSIGLAVKSFYDTTSGIEDTSNLQNVVAVTKSIIEALSTIPNTGGILGDLIGGKDYSAFATGLIGIGAAISSFALTTSIIKNVDNFATIVDATRTLMDGLAQIEPSGGFLESIFGGQDFAGFSTAMGNIAAGMETMGNVSNSVSDAGVFNTVVNATKSLISGLASITETGGLFSVIAGGTDFSGFATSMSGIGEGIASFASSTSGVSFDNVSSAVDAAKKILDFISSTADLDTSGVESFKTAVDNLAGTNIAGIVETFNGSAGMMGDIGKNLVQSIADGVSNATTNLTSAMQTCIDATITAANDKIAWNFYNAGKEISTEISNGVDDASSSISSSVEEAVSAAANAIKAYYGAFYSSGSYIVSGLVAGLRSKMYEVTAAADAIAREANRAANAAAKIQSPSRVFMKTGAYMGEGLVIGLNSYKDAVYDAGYGVGEESAAGLSNAISLINLDNLDMDYNPVIRPVLDLSDVRNDANSISQILSNNIPTSVMSNARSISRLMNARNQNGVNDDVVSELSKLRREIGDLNNTTYNVNGITYDDGTNIAAAVGQLVRAARIERRI